LTDASEKSKGINILFKLLIPNIFIDFYSRFKSRIDL